MKGKPNGSQKTLNQNKDSVVHAKLTVADCLPDSHMEDFTSKLIIVKASELKPEYRTSEHQLVQCSHGNGARPNAKGTSVFGKELFSGGTVCFGRYQIAGVADPTKLPNWAMNKIALLETLKAQIMKAQASFAPAPVTTSTMKQKIKSAKEKVRKADANKPNNHKKTKPKRNARE